MPLADSECAWQDAEYTAAGAKIVDKATALGQGLVLKVWDMTGMRGQWVHISTLHCAFRHR